jgi:hypothetical protein
MSRLLVRPLGEHTESLSSGVQGGGAAGGERPVSAIVSGGV